MLWLLSLPAAAQLSEDLVAALLAWLPTWGDWSGSQEILAAVLELPAVQHVHMPVSQLLQLGIRLGHVPFVLMLQQKFPDVSPTYAELEGVQLASLLHRAVKHQDTHTGCDLLSHPAAAKLMPQTVADLVMGVVVMCPDDCVVQQLLLLLPGAALLTAEHILSQILPVLETEVGHTGMVGSGYFSGLSSVLAILLRCPPVERLQAQDMQLLLSRLIPGPLLQAAACDAELWEGLLELPALQQLPSAGIATLVHACITAPKRQNPGV